MYFAPVGLYACKEGECSPDYCMGKSGTVNNPKLQDGHHRNGQ